MTTKIHRGTVYDHILAALRQSKSQDPSVNLAVLFHDISKSNTEGVDEAGEPTYHGHEGAAAELIERIAKRLKFSNEEKDAIIFAATYHMHRFQDMKKSKVVAIRQNPYWNTLKQTIHADRAARGKLFDKDRYDKEMTYVDDLFKTFGAKKDFENKMSKLVDGRRIMALVPKIKGEHIGAIKDQVRDWIVQKDFQVTNDEVDNLVKQLAKDLGYAAV